jgi:hypothetical protein
MIKPIELPPNIRKIRGIFNPTTHKVIFPESIMTISKPKDV